jgi:hypothetical protein
MTQLRFPARGWFRSTAGALVGLGVVAFAWVASGNERSLAAASNSGRTDLDGDGLTDLQEEVLGTRADEADTDGDGYSDLEERARGSDPLDTLSLPTGRAFSIGTVASLEGDQVSLLSAVFVNDGPAESVELRLGFVYRGAAVYLRPISFTHRRGFVRTGKDTQDRIAVVEVAVSQALVRRLGQLNLFSIATSHIPGITGSAVSVVPLVNFSGVTVSIDAEELNYSPINGGSGTPTGITYRPLAGDSGIPSSWSGGEICYQRTAAVGVDGVSIVHEVESADCQPMDTYCSAADCAASRGTSITLPDPAALAGG